MLNREALEASIHRINTIIDLMDDEVETLGQLGYFNAQARVGRAADLVKATRQTMLQRRDQMHGEEIAALRIKEPNPHTRTTGSLDTSTIRRALNRKR